MKIKRINVGCLRLGLNEKRVLCDIIDSGKLSEGSKTFEFEKAWAKYIGTKYSIAVNSGTSALIAGLTALKYKYNLKEGSKVITTPLTFIATINAIMHSGLRPAFVDVDRERLVITPQSIKEALKKLKGVSILLPVHLMGYPVDMDGVNELARKHSLLVVEDAAQAHGTIYKGKKVGSFSNLGIFSFYIAHNIQAGEMGAVNTDDVGILKLIKKLKAHGRMCECNICTRNLGMCPFLDRRRGNADLDPRFYHSIIGYNFKIMEFQAALALEQLKKANEIFKKRSENVKYLNEKLSKFKNALQLPYYSAENSYLAYPIIIKDTKFISRFKLQKELERMGIETRPLFGCVPTQQPAYHFLKSQYINKLPNAEYIGSNGFYIGCHQYLKKADLDYIISAFNKILK